MKETEVIDLLILVRGNWTRQPTDRETTAVWTELLAEADSRAAISAVKAYIATGDTEPPTPGQVAKLAVDMAARWRQQNHKLEEPEMPLSERARNTKFMRDISAAIGNRDEIVRVYAEFKGISPADAVEEIFKISDRPRVKWGVWQEHYCERCAGITVGPRVNAYYYLCGVCETATRWEKDLPTEKIKPALQREPGED